MSDIQSNHFSDEDKYDADSFDTLVHESSVNGSYDDLVDVLTNDDEQKTHLKEPQSDYWPVGSSSDEDDVVLGQTIAEINTDPIEFDGDDLSLTPAARVFKMASATREGMRADEMEICEESDESDEDVDIILQCSGDRKETYQHSAKTMERTEKLLTYHEKILVESRGIEIEEDFAEVVYDVRDGGEVDVGEPCIYEELAEIDKGIEEEEVEDLFANVDKDDELFADVDKDDELFDEKDEKDEHAGFSSEEGFETGFGDQGFSSENDKNDYDDDEYDDYITDDADTMTLEPSSTAPSTHDMRSETNGLRTDDSMEEFRRTVMLSQRMRCVSDGAGDGVHIRSRRSNIPVWVGRKLFRSIGDSTKISPIESCLRSMIPVSGARKPDSKEDFDESDTLTPHEKDNNENDGDEYMYDALCSYSMRLDMRTGSKETAPQRKKLKPGERRNKSFSNERLRDIERHNNILAHKILNLKPTYVLDEKKKKNSKFASLPPTTRVTSAEINRKKQQRQIDMDNQMLKRKLETIAKRKTKAKK